ncbi:MAG: radical SAM family heme chaperone HemW [Bacteroidales bacterium]|nr:radical SAM family heme chaperone HemW [Bacteroidales bacterium]
MVYLSLRNEIPSSQKMAGVYIHIPFCRSICHYCDFYRVASACDAGLYTDALKNELRLRAGYLRGEPVETIYFGGGTPSVLEADKIQEIIQAVSQFHGVAGNSEITLEANPDDLSDAYLRSLRELTSVNRLSIGVQSFLDRDLVLMNRRHTAAEACECVERAKEHGFADISVDLIYGIPGSTVADMAFNLNRLFNLEIQHLSAYHLTIEPKTVFYRKLEKGLITPVDEEDSHAQFTFLRKQAGNRGFIHYEISNWAKAGYFSRHNTGYWKGEAYIGLGPSAHSYDRVSRQWNVPDLRKYLRGITDEKPVFEKEVLTLNDHLNEVLLTSLRTMWGVDLQKIRQTFGLSVAETLMKGAEHYICSGHVRKEGNILTLTEDGYFISDAIVRNLMV